MLRRLSSTVGALAVLAWVLAGCSGDPSGTKGGEPIVAAPGMQTVTLVAKGMH